MFNRKDPIYYPDSLFDSKNISFSTFLYFKDQKISFSLHPTVSLFLTGSDPFEFIKLVELKKPKWYSSFHYVFNTWLSSMEAFQNTRKILEPLKGDSFDTILFSYSRTKDSLLKIDNIIKMSGISTTELLQMINIPMACHEFISHVLFEMFLDIYNIENDCQVKADYTPLKINYNKLFNYLDDLLKHKTMEELLVCCYFFRITSINELPNILLSNEKLVPLLNIISPKQEMDEELKYSDKIELISWEIFRQITSKFIDNKSSIEQIKIIHKLLKNNRTEIDNLIIKCTKLASEYTKKMDLYTITENIALYIKINLEKEINDLLKIDKKQFSEILNEIFSDEKTWFSIGTFIFSVITNTSPVLTTGSALAAIASFSAKNISVTYNKRKIIESSDLSLIYRMSKY